MSRAIYREHFPVQIGSQSVELPLVPIGPDRGISLLMTIDRGVRFIEQAGRDLAASLASARPAVVVAPATLGIPVAIEVTRALELDDYLILQKTPKIHLGDALVEPVRSITTDAPQRLLLDRARQNVVAGRRVALVDDVLATGSSLAAALRLLRTAGAEVVAIGVLLTEADEWRAALGADADLVHTLGHIPMFARSGDEYTPLGG